MDEATASSISHGRPHNDDAVRLLAAIVDASTDALITFTSDRRILTWNRGAAHMFGYDAQEAIGQSSVLLAPPDRIQEQASLVDRFLRGENIKQYETIRIRKNGEPFHASLTLSPIPVETGRIGMVLVLIQDISERRRAEETLRISEERFRMVFNSIDEGYALCELLYDEEGLPIDWRLLESNPSFERTAGLTVPASKTAVHLSPATEAYWLKTLDVVIKTGDAVRFEYYVEMMQRWFDVYLSSVGDASSHTLVIIFNDITERKHIALALGEAYEAEQTARQEAETALRVRDQFLSIASHELRTPLTSLIGYADMLRTGTIQNPEKMQDIAERIFRQANRLDVLMEPLLDISRLQRGQFALDVRPVNVLTVVTQVANDIRITLSPTTTLTLRQEHLDEPFMVMGDIERLEQVFQNLLSNAVKYSPAGSTIHVVVQGSETEAIVDVIDQGIGIPEPAQAHLFEAFYRAPNAGHQAGGFGLGLHIVQEIVERHGGRIEVESVEGEGSTFRVLLPLLNT